MYTWSGVDWCLVCSIWSSFGLLSLKKLRRLLTPVVSQLLPLQCLLQPLAHTARSVPVVVQPITSITNTSPSQQQWSKCHTHLVCSRIPPCYPSWFLPLPHFIQLYHYHTPLAHESALDLSMWHLQSRIHIFWYNWFVSLFGICMMSLRSCLLHAVPLLRFVEAISRSPWV